MYDLQTHVAAAAMGAAAFVWRWDSKTKERHWVRWQFLVVSAAVTAINLAAAWRDLHKPL